MLTVALSACQGDEGNPVGPVCPKCGPSTGGETGDFGGVLVPCPERVTATLDDARANGFDVSEFERRLSQPVDMSMRWLGEVAADQGSARMGLLVRGYEVETRIQATLSITSSFRYQREERGQCEGTTCWRCGSSVEVDVRVELRTLDGAVQATAEGVAWQAPGYENGGDPSDPYAIAFNASVDLRDVVGTLRFSTPRNATFHGRLWLSTRLFPDSFSRGQLSIAVDVDSEDARAWDLPQLEGDYFFPLWGEFPSTVGPGDK